MTARLRVPLRPVSVVLLLVLGGVSVAAALAVRDSVHDDQRRLLAARTAEAGVLVSSLFTGLATSLPILGEATNPRAGSATQFTAAATPLLGGAGAIGAVRFTHGQPELVATVGAAPTPGSTLNPGRTKLLAAAAASPGMVSTVLTTPRGRFIEMAAAAGNGLVVFEDLPLAALGSASSNSKGPFSELEGAVYASPDADPSMLVFATPGFLTASGPVARQQVTVGAQKWFLVARSTQPLVGTFAAYAPWILLVGGLLAAMLVTAMVEVFGRRRAYAMGLVEEKTLALQAALCEQERLQHTQRQARESAEAANRSKSEFLSRMSHELRTPLNAVLGFGQLLELDNLSGPQHESVEQIIKGGRHLLELINEVLDISRIETGTLPLSSEPVPVPEVIGDTLTLMRPLAEHSGVRILPTDRVGSNVHVMADRQRLKQILLNLVANAIKYNRAGGTVAVSCDTTTPGRLRITIADTGIGIRPQDMERLFVPFQRLGAERSDIEGTGVGLALSQHLAQAMGGTITVESTYGEGSQFTLELAAADDPLATYEPAPTTDSSQPTADEPAHRHTVLYIEDNTSNVRLVERILERRTDINLIHAMQGRLGLALAGEHHPTLILLDLHLPDINGDEVLRQLRDDPDTADTPVVMVSADATPGQIQRLLAAGATAYLTKPLDVQHLLDVVDDAIDASRSAV